MRPDCDAERRGLLLLPLPLLLLPLPSEEWRREKGERENPSLKRNGLHLSSGTRCCCCFSRRALLASRDSAAQTDTLAGVVSEFIAVPRVPSNANRDASLADFSFTSPFT